MINVVTDVLTGLGVPKYSSKKSKHTYSDHSKISMLVLRQYLDVSYETFSDDLRSFGKVMRALHIRNAPEASTLRKFIRRLDRDVMDDVLRMTALMVCGSDMTVAIDATGFSCSNASRHFVKRLRETGTYVSAIRGYSKASLAVDTDTLTILACVSSRSNVHDVIHVPEIIDRLDHGLNVRYVLADRGYDSEHVHRDIRARLGAETVIPVRRSKDEKEWLTKTLPRGKYRKMMHISFPRHIYRMRSKVETVNSIIKRRMSDIVYGRDDVTRHMEIMCRCVAHSVMRLLKIGVV